MPLLRAFEETPERVKDTLGRTLRGEVDLYYTKYYTNQWSQEVPRETNGWFRGGVAAEGPNQPRRLEAAAPPRARRIVGIGWESVED